MKKNLTVTIFIAGVVAGISLLSIISFDEKDYKKEEPAVSTCETKNWCAPPLPDSISFAGEMVPVNRWEVKEQLDREILFNYYWQNNVIYMLKLSSRYFPVIEQLLKQHEIPDDFKYLCVAESNMLQVTSRVGASGFWQLMKATAPEYNIEISETVDERYHVVKSTEAACRYLKQAHARFGNWTAAAASYNCGMGGYGDRSTYQKTNYYYDLVLPDETQRYIFRILAFKYLMNHSDSLGFILPQAERYTPIPTRTVVVDKNIPNLSNFAQENGSDYKMLKWLNPWLRTRSLKTKPGKLYAILLPE